MKIFNFWLQCQLISQDCCILLSSSWSSAGCSQRAGMFYPVSPLGSCHCCLAGLCASPPLPLFNSAVYLRGATGRDAPLLPECLALTGTSGCVLIWWKTNPGRKVSPALWSSAALEPIAVTALICFDCLSHSRTIVIKNWVAVGDQGKIEKCVDCNA